MKGIGNLSLDENSEWEKKNSKIKKNIYISVPSKVRKGEGETKNLRKMLVSQRQNKWNKHMEPIANYNRWQRCFWYVRITAWWRDLQAGEKAAFLKWTVDLSNW